VLEPHWTVAFGHGTQGHPSVLRLRLELNQTERCRSAFILGLSPWMKQEPHHAWSPESSPPVLTSSRKHYLTKGVGIVAPIPQMQDPTSRHFWILWAVAFLGFPAAVVAARRSTSCSVQPRE
jgi:hypothetical protein